MYINPFLAGILATLMAEILLVLGVALVKTLGGRH